MPCPGQVDEVETVGIVRMNMVIMPRSIPEVLAPPVQLLVCPSPETEMRGSSPGTHLVRRSVTRLPQIFLSPHVMTTHRTFRLSLPDRPTEPDKTGPPGAREARV